MLQNFIILKLYKISYLLLLSKILTEALVCCTITAVSEVQRRAKYTSVFSTKSSAMMEIFSHRIRVVRASGRKGTRKVAEVKSNGAEKKKEDIFNIINCVYNLR